MGPNVWQDLPGHVDVPSHHMVVVAVCLVIQWGLSLMMCVSFAVEVMRGAGLGPVLTCYAILAFNAWMLRNSMDIRARMIEAGC
jgi:hypothetical protein